jgi:DNA-binding NarL/FixJ family response regulator
MKQSNNYSFLIADRHCVVRHGLSLIIKESFLNAEVYQTKKFSDIIKTLRETKIDLLILDVNFPEGSSLNILKEIKSIQPNAKILIFSICDEDSYAIRYLKAGASGFLSKECCEDEIKHAINAMLFTGKYITTRLKNKILDSCILKKPVNPLDLLSNRELEVARLLVDGYGNLEIMRTLKIKSNTISTYKFRIFEKLEIDNLAKLIKLYFQYSDAEN